MRATTRAALAAGHRRWLERMRALKAAGVITRFAGGRRPRGSAPASSDPHIRRAQRLIEELTMKKSTSALPAPALPARPWDELTTGEKLVANTDLSLDIIRQILELGVDPENVKLLAQIKDAALTIISQQIRVEEGRLRPPASDGRMPEYEAALARYEEREAQRLGVTRPKRRKPQKQP
jgi:hypothetical protein